MTKITGHRVATEENQGTISFQTGGTERLNISQGGTVALSGAQTLAGAVTIGATSASTDLVGFYGRTAVAIQSTTATTGTFAANAGTAALSGSSWVGNVGTRAYTVSDVITALKNYGLLVS